MTRRRCVPEHMKSAFNAIILSKRLPTPPLRGTPPRRGSLAVQRLQVLGEFRQVGGTDNDAVFDDLFAVEPERLL